MTPFFGLKIYPELALKKFVLIFSFSIISKKFLAPAKFESLVSLDKLKLFGIELCPAK